MRCGARRPDSSCASPTATRTTKSPVLRPATSWCSPPASASRTTSGIRRSRRSTEAGFRVLRYDYYGRGFSDRPDVPYTQAFYVRQLTELLDSLKVTESIDLAGLSLGGRWSPALRTPYPDRVRSLIYVDPVVQVAQVDAASPDAARLELPDRHLHRARMGGRAARRLSSPGTLSRLAGSVSRADAVPRLPTRAPVRAGQPTPPSISGRRSSASANTHGPSSSSGGSRIRGARSNRARPLLEAMPRARLVTVEDSGHLPQWEQPAIVNAALVEFLHEVNGLPG